MAADQLYIAWTEFQRRQLSMAHLMGFECLFFPVERRASKLRKVALYAGAFWRSLEAMWQHKPSVVWVQLPQTPALWAAQLYRLFVNRQLRIVADCHNAMFREPWNRLPLGNWSVSHASLILVHNDDMLSKARQQGFPEGRTLVVEDPPADIPSGLPVPPCVADLSGPFVVFPASFAADEPIAELIEAARLCPEVTFVVTGNPKRYADQNAIRQSPVNLRFVGYLPWGEFDGLIANATAVLALTRFDGIQLSVCGEAVGAGRPLVCSGTPLLRRLFPKGSFFVEGETPVDLVDAVRRALAGKEFASEEMLAFKAEFIARWLAQRGSAVRGLLRTVH